MQAADLKGTRSGIALALLLVSTLALGQDAPAEDDLQPAVDTSAALEPAADAMCIRSLREANTEAVVAPAAMQRRASR